MTENKITINPHVNRSYSTHDFDLFKRKINGTITLEISKYLDIIVSKIFTLPKKEVDKHLKYVGYRFGKVNDETVINKIQEFKGENFIILDQFTFGTLVKGVPALIEALNKIDEIDYNMMICYILVYLILIGI